MERKSIPVTLEQSKLLASALRMQIMNLIAETPRTAKQVADLLKKTPGNIHYHMQRLFDADLLELVDTRTVGGVVEKYYRSRGTLFEAQTLAEDAFPYSEQVLEDRKRVAARLKLSDGEAKEFLAEFHQLLNKYDMRDVSGDEYVINMFIGRLKEDEE
ncbi:helix-turn-helix transcriptional regulator [Tumebacillus sp. ITR2]|uniref:Helix-turn-helix transcriptional regulator n=1 Tax=Tumebacillus amylolyticus TaxID=2801339 RepID=A0ABS1JEW4_9BACL|nr:winged helix-turn-helix domain-containing protein [Tumebacillus amylolyticus]MBL0388534.1 helix-turn-helix transcriptional regulator [Tumebacillus amylolyticus]